MVSRSVRCINTIFFMAVLLRLQRYVFYSIFPSVMYKICIFYPIEEFLVNVVAQRCLIFEEAESVVVSGLWKVNIDLMNMLM